MRGEVSQAYEYPIEGMPVLIDWGQLSAYEFEDNTVSSQTLACTGGGCEI